LLNTDIVVSVKKVRGWTWNGWFPRYEEYTITETKKLSEILQEKTANMMKSVSNSIMK
jgi:hypothetical protein